MTYATDTHEGLLSLRHSAEQRCDWPEARKLTEELAARGAFDSDVRGVRLLRASRDRRITPAEAAEKAAEIARRCGATGWHQRPVETWEGVG